MNFNLKNNVLGFKIYILTSEKNALYFCIKSIAYNLHVTPCTGQIFTLRPDKAAKGEFEPWQVPFTQVLA